MKAMRQFNDMMYKDEYVEFGLELVQELHFIHVNVLKKDKDTRERIEEAWLGLQEYLLSKGIIEVYAFIGKDNTRLKEFSSSYGFTKETEEEDGSEIWIAELK